MRRTSSGSALRRPVRMSEETGISAWRTRLPSMFISHVPKPPRAPYRFANHFGVMQQFGRYRRRSGHAEQTLETLLTHFGPRRPKLAVMHKMGPEHFESSLTIASMAHYLFAAVSSARACTLPPSTRLTGGLRIT